MSTEGTTPAEVGSSEGLGLAATRADDARAKAIDWAVRNHETKWTAVQWAYDAAVAAERERCAKACERISQQYKDAPGEHALERAANAIRLGA